MTFFVSCKVFVGCCKHQFDTVDLIDFAGAGVVVDGNDVCFRMLMAKLFDYAFADNVGLAGQPNGCVQMMFGAP